MFIISGIVTDDEIVSEDTKLTDAQAQHYSDAALLCLQKLITPYIATEIRAYLNHPDAKPRCKAIIKKYFESKCKYYEHHAYIREKGYPELMNSFDYWSLADMYDAALIDDTTIAAYEDILANMDSLDKAYQPNTKENYESFIKAVTPCISQAVKKRILLNKSRLYDSKQKEVMTGLGTILFKRVYLERGVKGLQYLSKYGQFGVIF